MAHTPTRTHRRLLPAVGVVAALALSGCGTDDAGTPDPTPTPGGGTEETTDGTAADFAGVELSVWNNIYFDPYQTLQQQYFESCADELGITVDVQTISGEYHSRLLQAASANELPDVVQLSTDIQVPSLASQGVLADLGTLGLTTQGQSDVVAALGEYDGTLYALPVQVEAFALFYDADAFAEAGIEGPPATFDELLTTAAALTTHDRYGIVLPGTDDGAAPQYFLPFLLSAEGDPADPTGPGAVAAVDLYAQLVEQGSLSREFVNWGWDAPDQWKAGNAAITVTGPWELVNSGLEVTYETAQFPTLTAGEDPVVNLLGYGYGVAAQDDPVREQAAAALIECRASEENQLETAIEGGYVPALTSAQDAFVAEVPAAASFVDAVPNAFNPATLGTDWNVLQQVYVDALQDATVNGVDAQQALETALLSR